MRKQHQRITIALVLGAMAAACGGAQVPQAQLTDAKSSARAADAMGAKQEPQAALHLKMAQDAIVDAEHRISEGDNEAAVPILERAVADASLAQALTREAETKRNAEQALVRLNGLERELKSRNELAPKGGTL